MRAAVLVFSFLISQLFLGQSIAGVSNQESLRQEEMEDYYQKWLNQDVVYIISDEERAVFEGLSSPDEKEQFIEQFWFRRDPDPRTVENEFKEEHYRRIAYANAHFTSGFDGWKTDRGRVYIIHGPPAEIESHASGGTYERPISEGGGMTSTYPFEIWRYRNIEGLGLDIILEFVDPSMSGEYRLALHPEEKDALLNIPGAGLTLAEQLGMAEKADRPWFSPGQRDAYPVMVRSSRDNPFSRYETFARVRAPQPVKYADLKELVSVNISYSSLPFSIQEHFFKLNEAQVIVPVSVQLEHSDLDFTAEGGRRVARVAIYGAVASITNRLVTEFEEDLVAVAEPGELEKGYSRHSIYQKVLVLDRSQRYKLDLVVKDQASQKLGTIRKALVPPANPADELTSSSIILSNYIRVLDSIPDQDEMFVLGDVKIRPNLSRKFPAGDPLGMYFQVYNARVDQASGSPSLTILFRVMKDGKQLRQVEDANGESIQYFSDQRAVVIKRLPVEDFGPGKYLVQVEVEDHLTGKKLELAEPLELVSSPER